MNLRQIALVTLAAVVLGGMAAVQVVAQTGPSAPTTPPPPPPPNGSVATPGTLIGTPAPATAPPSLTAPAASASPAPAGRRGRRSAATPSPEPGPSDTPAPPQFSTMDGVWEVQLQPMTGNGRTVYSHLYVSQKADGLSGTWVRDNNVKVPFSGTFDGRLFKLTATDAKRNVYTMSGYAENFSDMVGLLMTADPKDKGVPFTASHRKKDRLGL